MSIHISNHCDEQEFLDAVRLNGLLKFNMNKTSGKLKIPDEGIVYVARDETGAIVGGISGVTYLSSLKIDVLWVHESRRNQNIASRLMKKIEDKARKLGCQLSHLTTYSFQAPLFYEKNGYTVCGEIDGFPDDICMYLLKKQL